MKDDVGSTVRRIGRPRSPQAVGVMHTCKRHGWTEHAISTPGGRRRPRLRCKRCSAEAVTRRHRRVRALLLKQAGGACAICGYDRCALNLHFHHVDPAQKSFEMSMARGKSLAAYQAELEKCVLVCANCHGEIETGLIVSPPPIGGGEERPQLAFEAQDPE